MLQLECFTYVEKLRNDISHQIGIFKPEDIAVTHKVESC